MGSGCDVLLPLDYPATSSGGGSIARRFYYLEANPKGSSLERFPTLLKRKIVLYVCAK